MPSQPTNCPRCDSEQAFPRRKKHFHGDVYVVYIQCTMCRWREDIEHTTTRLDRIRRQQGNLKRLAKHEAARYGRPTANTELRQQRMKLQLREESARIRRKVRQHAVPANV